MKKNTLVIHGCGGCGVNLTASLQKELGKVAEGFPNIVTTYIDTTSKNVDHLDIGNDERENCYIIKDNNYKGEQLDGSGGERRANVEAISASIDGYLDSRGIKKYDEGTFHVVIFSAGGGSGSVIGPVLANAMIQRDIPTLVIMVGDHRTGNWALNTMNTIATVQRMSKVMDKPISIYYVNNSNMPGDGYAEREERANQNVINFMFAYAMFVSGENFALDNQDMRTFLDFSLVSSIEFPSAAYVVKAYGREVILPEGVDAFIGRTLTHGDIDPKPGVDLIHWKHGQMPEASVNVAIAEEELPVHLVLTSGILSKETKMLQSHVARFRKRVDEFETEQVKIDSGAIETDDGLIV